MAVLAQATTDQAFSRDMKIGLFILCHIDMVYPDVGMATFSADKREGLGLRLALTRETVLDQAGISGVSLPPALVL
jgi:hypothetical protein